MAEAKVRNGSKAVTRERAERMAEMLPRRREADGLLSAMIGFSFDLSPSSAFEQDATGGLIMKRGMCPLFKATQQTSAHATTGIKPAITRF